MPGLTVSQEQDLQRSIEVLRSEGWAPDRLDKYERKIRELNSSGAWRDAPVTMGMLCDFIGEAVAPMVKRLREVEEQQKQFRYIGVYEAGRSYAKGNFVTHDGSVWHANTITGSKPGADNTWTLAVKRGQRR